MKTTNNKTPILNNYNTDYCEKRYVPDREFDNVGCDNLHKNIAWAIEKRCADNYEQWYGKCRQSGIWGKVVN